MCVWHCMHTFNNFYHPLSEPCCIAHAHLMALNLRVNALFFLVCQGYIVVYTLYTSPWQMRAGFYIIIVCISMLAGST